MLAWWKFTQGAYRSKTLIVSRRPGSSVQKLSKWELLFPFTKSLRPSTNGQWLRQLLLTSLNSFQKSNHVSEPHGNLQCKIHPSMPLWYHLLFLVEGEKQINHNMTQDRWDVMLLESQILSHVGILFQDGTHLTTLRTTSCLIQSPECSKVMHFYQSL